MTKLRAFLLAALITGVLSFAGCSKKAAQAIPPAAPPAPATPTATLSASPDVIQEGQSTTLVWQTQNASEITISGVGTVPASGSRSVSPSGSTTYSLTAKGAGGTQNASARVTVNGRAADATPSPTEEELFARNVKDVLFDYDKSNIRADQAPTARNDAAFLLQHPSIKVLVEGHCDDRGSEEYNLALGTSRAESLKRALQEQGVSAERMKTISYGKEKPFCSDNNEQCWQQNRVDHFSIAR
jgi:peptidoglycan-associated lipoprotein